MCCREKQEAQTPPPYGSLGQDIIFTWTGGIQGKKAISKWNRRTLQGRVRFVDRYDHRLGDHPVRKVPRQTGLGHQLHPCLAG